MGAHLQGVGAGMSENVTSEGRGQQPLRPSAGRNNVGARFLSQGGIREGEGVEKKKKKRQKDIVGKRKEDNN